MSNWVTLKNGVHIDLDDPTNPITGSGTFEETLNKNFNGLKNMPKIEGAYNRNSNLNKANPKRNQSPEYDKNCPNCCIAYILRENGYDVEAKGNINGATGYEIGKCFGLKAKDIDRLPMVSSQNSIYNKMKTISIMKNYGSGAKAIIIAEFEIWRNNRSRLYS